MRFDLIDLRLFLYVLETGSITHGAAQANMSLPSASARLRGMEEALRMPLLALWGADGVMGTTLPILDLWREYADDVRGRALERCGHFLPEERPGEVVDELRTFLAGAR